MAISFKMESTTPWSRSKTRKLVNLADAFLAQAQILARQCTLTHLEQAENLLIQGLEWDSNNDGILKLEFEITKGLVALRQGLFSKGKKVLDGVKKSFS